MFKSIVKVFLLSFSFDYAGGLLTIFEVGSVHSMQLLLAIIALIIDFGVKKRPATGGKKVIISLLIFTIYASLNRNSFTPEYSAYTVQLLWWNLSTLLLIYLAIKQSYEVYWFILFGMFQIFASQLWGDIDLSAVTRVSNGEPIINARLAGILILGSIYFVRAQKYILSLPLFVVGVIIMILSATRSVYLALAIILFVDLFDDKSLTATLKKVLSYGVVILVLSLVLNNLSISADLLERGLSTFSIETFINGNALERSGHFLMCIQMFRLSPLFGHGLGGFASNTIGIDERYYPHNLFLEVLAELGLVGIVLFVLILVRCMWILKNIRERISRAQFLFARDLFLFGLITAQTSLDIGNQFSLFLSFAILIIIYNYKRDEKISLHQ